MTQIDRPKTLALRAAPGELLKRPVGRPRIHAAEPERDDKYLALIRKLPCLCCGMEPPPNNEAAHVRRQSAAHGKRGGMQKKPHDKWALPLCHDDHAQQHKIGELQFWYDAGISPLLVCTRLYAARYDLVVMCAVIYNAIAERESLSQVGGVEL